MDIGNSQFNKMNSIAIILILGTLSVSSFTQSLRNSSHPDSVCNFDCKYDGFFAYPGNCAKYVICQNGKPNCHMCRKRKLFRLFCWLDTKN